MPSHMNTDYDIGKAFAAIEDELISSMMRNLDRHRAEETKLGYNWTQWQVDQLKYLEKYKADNKEKYKDKFKDINSSVDAMLSSARSAGGTAQEQQILKAIKNGFEAAKDTDGKGVTAAFFRLNTRKMEALQEATKNDLKTAEKAMLRMSNDKYRQIIYNAQVYANTGAGTYEKAVDMATKDFLKAGINCIEYKNGSRHSVKEYAKMAIKTASKRAYLTGEGEQRKKWGITTVIMNKRGNACPKCLPFVGKVLIDDVWSGGKASDGPYQLMSSAMEAGLYHPNCKDSHTTYFEGLDDDEISPAYTKKELENIKEDYRQEQKQQYAGRMAEQFDRLSKYSLDPDNQKMYAARNEQWEQQLQSIRKDSEYQDRIRQKREMWKKRDSVFDKENAKTEINNIKKQIEGMQKQINTSLEKEKVLEKKVYFDGTGTDEEMKTLRQYVSERKKLQEQVDTLNKNKLDKQEIYKNEAQNRILKEGIVEEIKLSKKMTPETVDILEETLHSLKDKYGIMPKGIVYNPSRVTDATATYNWLDDKIYLSSRINDINEYADVIKKSEESLLQYRNKYDIININKENLRIAEQILLDKNIKGYEREKAIVLKAESEIELNIQRVAVREDFRDVLTHEYGHFIHRHANDYYSMKSKVFGAKDLGGKYICGDWSYEINTRYSAKAKIEAAKISQYATKNPYEAFAEGFLAKEKGQKIPESIEKVIEEAKVKAGVKNVANAGKSDILITGARIIDPDSSEGVKFANMYYEEIRKFSTDTKKIAENLGKDELQIRKIKEYLFENKSLYNPKTNEYERFEPDCAIAQSWQRLMIGKDIKKHDRTLIEHELLEMKIKEEKPDIDHIEAHRLASMKYNYPKEVGEYYGDIEKHKKN